MSAAAMTETEARHIAEAVADYVWREPISETECADLKRVILGVAPVTDFNDYSEKIAKAIDEWRATRKEPET